MSGFPLFCTARALCKRHRTVNIAQDFPLRIFLRLLQLHFLQNKLSLFRYMIAHACLQITKLQIQIQFLVIRGTISLDATCPLGMHNLKQMAQQMSCQTHKANSNAIQKVKVKWDKSFPSPTSDIQGLSAWKMLFSNFLPFYLLFSNMTCSRKQI